MLGFVGGGLYALLSGWDSETTAFLAFGCGIGLGILSGVVAALMGGGE